MAKTPRHAPLELTPEQFRALGHRLVDELAAYLESLPRRPVTPGEEPSDVQALLGNRPLPQHGTPPDRLLEETTRLLLEHSLFNGHPRFWGYITSSAAPIGALADMIAASVNPNVAGWPLSPLATEIEVQTVRWIAELTGYPQDCGGLLVSGGNMANFIGFWVGRRVKAPWDLRARGVRGSAQQLRVYCSAETHTWIQKAADLSGLGTDAIRWIPTDDQLRMRTDLLLQQIVKDKRAGDLPLMVIGTAGSVSTGAIDPLPEMARICREHDLWFHVDGAYGAAAAVVPDAPDDLRALSLADSLAMDPHKWLYAPLEAGCALVRDPELLRDTFSYHPPYYPDEEETWTMYHEYGPQNSRGFRALKVWLGLRQVGREGYVQMIGDDCLLARELFHAVQKDAELEAFTHSLSITTFRYVPADLRERRAEHTEYLNTLNKNLLERLQTGGEAYLSNAVIGGAFVLRACVVNFRTTLADIQALPPLVTRLGRELDAAARSRTTPPKGASST